VIESSPKAGFPQGLKQAAEKGGTMVKMKKTIPQRLKPVLILRHLRHG
jgi:hypothetical protein